MLIASFPGPIPSFSMLHSEKIGEPRDKAMHILNYHYLCMFYRQILMSVGVLFAGTMLVCCLGLITGGPADEDQKR